jgi:Tfp pilus assembly protein PilE
MRNIKNIVIHCSASGNGDARVTRDEITRWHKEKNGWRDIGYHYVIEADGRVAIGRHEDEIGAHVSGENGSSIGVCIVGTDRFSQAQWESLRDVVSDLTTRYPQASVWGHRDFSPDKDGDGVIEEHEWFKTCPGFDVNTWRLSGMDPQWNMAHVFPDPATAQAGFTVVQMAAAVAILGMVTALFFGAKSMLDGARKDGHTAGHKAAMLEVAQRDNKQLSDARAKIAQLQADKELLEKNHADKVAKIDKEGTDARKTAEQQRDAARARARDFEQRLREHTAGQTNVGCPGGGGDTTATAIAGTGVGDGKAREEGAGLSEKGRAFLLAEADRGDTLTFDYNATVDQLNACQAIAIADRSP